jgi:arylsulfatase A-like enzyme
MQRKILTCMSLVMLVLMVSFATAQEKNAIPYPNAEWKGVQGKTLADSKPDFIGQPEAPEGAPNVLVIMLDDAGYSSATSFGGVMRTPSFDRIGDEGIRYTHMSVAAVCSPTRGSLLTGYNIHQIGTGIISEFATGYPGYNSQIDYTTPSIAKILTENGYATAAFGKWHNTPMEEASPAGPFESWPTGIWGFEYFWGFLGGETNQFHPLLYENTTAIETPKTNADGSEFHISHGMADQAIKWLDNWKGLRDVPFFMYYTPGAVHAPIQVPKEWRDKYKGQFDDGWHVYRQQLLERQKKLGLVPEDAKMVDWPEVIPEWDSFSEEGKEYLARQMEVNAAFMEHVDYHVGRVIEHIEDMGELDNTLVIYLTADNGCTAEGTPTGTFSELLMQNGFPPLTMEQQLEKLEEFGGLEAWGGPHLANHYSVAWAYASTTPFQWTKQMASHFGGTISAAAIRYPKAIKARGEWRRQFQPMVPNFISPTVWPTRRSSGWTTGKDLRDNPFFMYYTPGAVHAPIQVPKEWRDKYKGQFDDGWHVYRQQLLERQKKLGLVPEDAKMVDWPEVIPEWDSFSEEGKEYLARQMEVNAAFMEHVDYHVGRVIEHIEDMGELDNTLVIYLTADNGCTAEGTPTGTFSELLMQNGFPPLTMEQQLEKLEEFGGLEAWGGPHLANHYSVAWAYASTTPFQWTKQMASHFGGTISATAIRYPKAIKAKRRMAATVSECHRSGTDHSGSDRRSGARLCERPEKKTISGEIADLCME